MADPMTRELHPAPIPKRWWTPRNLSLAVKSLQFEEFYGNELAAWRTNGPSRRDPSKTVREALYENRAKYLHKGPDKLTDAEILRGLRISGEVRGYTRYDMRPMAAAIRHWGVHDVADPCAGWGERALWCAHEGVGYEGVDANEGLAAGYARMRKLGMLGAGQTVAFGDSAVHVWERPADAIACCPPYWNAETYSADGAENLDWDGFRAWWREAYQRCAEQTGARLALVQSNMGASEALIGEPVRLGWEVVAAFEASSASHSSHMTRRRTRDLKHESETLYVMRRR